MPEFPKDLQELSTHIPWKPWAAFQSPIGSKVIFTLRWFMTFVANLVWWHHLLFQVLDLHDNQLASLPADIGQLTALQVKDVQLHPRCLDRACLGPAGVWGCCGLVYNWSQLLWCCHFVRSITSAWLLLLNWLVGGGAGKEEERSRRRAGKARLGYVLPAWCSPSGSHGQADALSKESLLKHSAFAIVPGVVMLRTQSSV